MSDLYESLSAEARRSVPFEHFVATTERPPHFPNPNADPVAILEARIVELEEINAAQFAELTGWRTQLEAALARLSALEAK